MTGERLLPCWSCGSDHVGPTGGMNIIMCGNCGAGPDEEWIWQSRALGPALDRVIAEVEARLAPVKVQHECDEHEMWPEDLAIWLRALRAEHSAGEGEDE